MPAGLGGLGQLFVVIEAKTAQFSRGMKLASEQTRTFSRKSSQYVQDHAAQFRKAGLIVTAVSGAIGLALSKAVKPALAFQTQMAQVSTMLSEETMPYMKQFESGIKDMSVEFGESTDTLSKGLYDILSASIAPAKAMGVLAVSATAARAGITDTGVAADAVTTILNAYGLSADKAGDVSDLLFAIVKRGKTTFAELAPAIGKVAAIASLGGVSLEEFGAALATSTRAGIETNIAVTSLKGAVTAYVKPTEAAAKIAKKYGIELSSSALKSVGLRKAILKLAEAPAELTAAIFPNVRAFLGMAAAMKDTEGFLEDIDVMMNRQGMTQEAYQKQVATAQFKIDQLKSAMKIFFIEALTPILPALANLVAKIREFVEGITSYLKEHPGLSKALIKIAAGFAALGAVVGPLAIALPTLAKVLPLVGRGFHALLGPIGLVTAAAAGILLILDRLEKKYETMTVETGRSTESLIRILEKQRDVHKRTSENVLIDMEIRKKAMGKLELVERTLGDLRKKLQEEQVEGEKVVTEVIKEEGEKRGEMSDIELVALEERLAKEKEEREKLQDVLMEQTLSRFEYERMTVEKEMELLDERDANYILARQVLENKLIKIDKEEKEKLSKIGAEAAEKEIERIFHLTAVSKNRQIALLRDARSTYAADTIAYRQYTNAILTLEKAKTEKVREMIVGTADIVANTFAGSLTGMILEGKSFAEGVKGLWKDVKNYVVDMISKMISKWLVFTALRGIFKFFGLGFLFHEGGVVPKYQFGGTIKGPPGKSVPILAEAEEVIIPAPLAKALREVFLKSPVSSPVYQGGGVVAGGGGVSFGDIHITVDVDKFSTENLEEACRQISEAVRAGLPRGVELAKLVQSTGVKFGGEAF